MGLTSAEVVYRELRHRIITKQFKAGQRLPEVKLAEQLQVSRTPVREALRKLASEGLVVLIPNSGARLVSPTKKEIEDTYEVRAAIEELSVRKAAKKITPLQICKLEETIKDEELIFPTKDLEAYINVNEIFHKTIAEAAGNLVLLDYLENILARTFVYMIFYETFFDIKDNPSLDEHKEIVEALKEHNEEKAAKLMHRHIYLSIESLHQTKIKREMHEDLQYEGERI